MNCHNCGANNPDGAPYCSVCGTIFPEAILHRERKAPPPYPPRPGASPARAVPAHKKAWFWLLVVFVALPVTIVALRVGALMLGRGFEGVASVFSWVPPVPAPPPAPAEPGEEVTLPYELADPLLPFLPINTDEMAVDLERMLRAIDGNLSITLDYTRPEGNVLSLSVYNILDGNKVIGTIRSTHDPVTDEVLTVTMEYDAMETDDRSKDTLDNAYRALSSFIFLIDQTVEPSEIMNYEKGLGEPASKTKDGILYSFYSYPMPDPAILRRHSLTVYVMDGINRGDGELSFGDTFVFKDLEITLSDEIVWDREGSRSSGRYMRDVFLVPITLKNIGNETGGMETFLLFQYGPDGVELDSVSSPLNHDVPAINSMIRPGATHTTYIAFPYEGDGDYYVEFNNLVSEILGVRLPIAK